MTSLPIHSLNQAAIKHVQCASPAGFHNMAYKQWGDPENPKVLICVHGLTRISDDFDYLAQAMSDAYRVICPDMAGRGRSDWLRDPYCYTTSQYVSDMVALVARADVEAVDWFGTSMGGLIGMGLASMPGNPVRKLLLNDIGAILNPVALGRICGYVGQSGRFATLEEGIKYVRALSVTFGTHTDQQWRKFAGDVLRQNPDGSWRLHYDPALAIPLQAITPEKEQRNAALLLAAYDAIVCPTLLVRGAESDLLTRDVAQQMTRRGPKVQVVEIEGVGHAPMFVNDEQVAIARKFFVG